MNAKERMIQTVEKHLPDKIDFVETDFTWREIAEHLADRIEAAGLLAPEWIDANDTEKRPESNKLVLCCRGPMRYLGYWSDATQDWWDQDSKIRLPDFYQILPQPPKDPK